MTVTFVHSFLNELPRGKKKNLTRSLVKLSMYINYLDLYINLLEWKYFSTEDKNRKIEYCNTLAVLDEELETYRKMYPHIREKKNFEDENEYSSEERLRRYVTFGLRCRQQYRLMGSMELKNRAKGIEEAVKILLRIKRGVERSYVDNVKKKTNDGPLVQRVFNGVVSKFKFCK